MEQICVETAQLRGLEARVAAFEVARCAMFADLSRGAIGVVVGCGRSSIVVWGIGDCDSPP
jgi:hypothetical protein